MSKQWQWQKLMPIVGMVLLNGGAAIPRAALSQAATSVELRVESRSAVRPIVGRPDRQGQGASRGDCPQVSVPLTALVPLTEGKTLAPHPTIWFYIPYTRTIKGDVSAAFRLLDSKGNAIGSEIPIPLPAAPGIVGVRFPATITLEPKQTYHWFFNIYCSGRDQPPTSVEGSMQRVTPDLVVDKPLLDALTTLAEQRLTKPQDAALLAQWKQLLQQLAFEPSELEQFSVAPLTR